MIFIGSGSLLWRAVRFAAAGGHPIDLVCIGADETVPPGLTEVAVLVTDDVNAEFDTLAGASTDGVVWSINNWQILRAPLVGSALRIYNIHNGLLPAYRGRPEVAIIHAILRGEATYGATLHVVDEGIDTGGVIDVEAFGIGVEDRFQEVMMAGVRACHTLFERNLAAVLDATAVPAAPHRGESGYFGRNQIADLPMHRGNENFERATALGVFSPMYPDVIAALTTSVNHP